MNQEKQGKRTVTPEGTTCSRCAGREEHGWLCPKCNALSGDYIGFLLDHRKKHSHMCATCANDEVTCGAPGIKFGNGKGNDNVYRCDGYSEKEKRNTAPN